MPELKLPIGISDFKELREQDLYYVDKSSFICGIMGKATKVFLFPRPRRFGKTLNLSMLRYFLEKTEESNRSLFDGLEVAQHSDVMKHQGQYPLIYLTFKDVKETQWDTCLKKIAQLLIEEMIRHYPNIESILTVEENKTWRNLIDKEADLSQIENSLRFLMILLHRATGQKVVLLIDEYDAPIHAGWQYGYYDEVILFMRNLLSGALKDNSDLEKGVLTGILRVAKESIFSGLNNLSVFSILNQRMSDAFGFTEAEVDQILTDAQLLEHKDAVKEWYNGYRFGNEVIYNPWSILQFADNPEDGVRPLWINTSANELIYSLITSTESSIQEDMETLLDGGTIKCPLNDNIVLREIDQSPETIWNFLTFSGYLKPIAKEMQDFIAVYELAVPNREVLYFFHTTIRKWLRQTIGNDSFQPLLQALINENIETFGDILQDIVMGSLSFHDIGGKEPERVYHAFVLGLLIHFRNYFKIRSNRESGYGRYDLLLCPIDHLQTGFILEFKKVNHLRNESPEVAMEKALKQIQEKKYATELQEYGVSHVVGVGIVIDGKKVWVDSVTIL